MYDDIREEYEELIKRNMFLSLKNAELEDKIDKAIEYIKTNELDIVMLELLAILGEKENE